MNSWSGLRIVRGTIYAAELEIVTHLQADAALSVGEVAELMGVSKSACWRRIQKLEQAGIIKRQVTLLDAGLRQTLSTADPRRPVQCDLQLCDGGDQVHHRITALMPF